MHSRVTEERKEMRVKRKKVGEGEREGLWSEGCESER